MSTFLKIFEMIGLLLQNLFRRQIAKWVIVHKETSPAPHKESVQVEQVGIPHRQKTSNGKHHPVSCHCNIPIFARVRTKLKHGSCMALASVPDMFATM